MVCTTVTDGLFESDGWSVLLQRTIRSISSLSLLHRNREAEYGAFAFLGSKPQFTAILHDKILAQQQAQSRAFFVVRAERAEMRIGMQQLLLPFLARCRSRNPER